MVGDHFIEESLTCVFMIIQKRFCEIKVPICQNRLTSILSANRFEQNHEKIISNKVPKGSNRLKIALRNAANAIGNLKDTHLANFFKKVLYRKERTAALSATARKLAVITWNMIVKKQPYNPPTQYLFLDQKRKMGLIKKMKKQISKFVITGQGLEIVTA
jgi:hypothetical protein